MKWTVFQPFYLSIGSIFGVFAILLKYIWIEPLRREPLAVSSCFETIYLLQYPLSSPFCLFLSHDDIVIHHSVVSDSLWPHGLQHARLPFLYYLSEFAQTHGDILFSKIHVHVYTYTLKYLIYNFCFWNREGPQSKIKFLLVTKTNVIMSMYGKKPPQYCN